MQTLYNSIVLLKIPDELEFTIIGAVILFGVAGGRTNANAGRKIPVQRGLARKSSSTRILSTKINGMQFYRLIQLILAFQTHTQ